ncbi:hypothetical protein HJ01_01725 [Flavobacterium frigoris PS1]|uniref:Uncharacterized protein n=1 Tax=Flavobacterium frigoris (strain PS1) TaxID=1086011 RepID=H7FRH6_FLAFP|nr:hypothetical protein HJ01_01725 [Flavobacterium frigoris PS1]
MSFLFLWIVFLGAEGFVFKTTFGPAVHYNPRPLRKGSGFSFPSGLLRTFLFL